jgi:carbon-monoxide dehydrogenase large subunit
VTALAAQRLGRAVRWVATRSEDFLVTQGSRETIVEATLAATASGRFVALQVQAWTNVGAYASAPGPAQRLVSLLTGAYDIPVAAAEVSGVYTNTPPTGAYRGAGRPEASYVIERLVEATATTLGMDAIALRRRNFIPPDAFPYRTPLGTTYDSGDYATALDRALALADATDGAPPTGGADSELWGIGVASYIEPTGGGWESGRLWVEPDGRVVVVSGSVPQGQSHATTFAQIVADRLGVRFDDVSVRQGDTADGLPGIGTFGSRSTALGGSALAVVADEVYGRARQIAAHLLEAAPEDVVARAGRFSIVGVTASERSVSWAEVAAAAASGRLPAGLDPNLDARTRFDMGGEAFASGTCVAVVSVERTTGVIRLRRLVLVHDCGVAVNPRLVEAQLHGGLAQGVGEALGEWLRCGDDGQVLAGSLLDYWLPHADDLPFFELDAVVSPSPINPLGVKGVGEAGTIAAPTAILHAALAALRPIGVTALDLPLTSERLWRAVSGR